MSVYVNITFRIKRSFSQEDAMKKLVAANIFDGYKDILMISAIIGYNQKRFVPIEKTASDGVQMNFFSQRDYDVMDMIAYAHKREQSIIKSDEKYDIFSSYANGGFPILLERLAIKNINEITPDEAKIAIRRYYMLLLANGFKPEEVTNEDVFI